MPMPSRLLVPRLCHNGALNGAIESNGRQYCPEANRGWDERFPGLFSIRDGMMNTAILTGPGLGAV